jgi:hypothetical protein
MDRNSDLFQVIGTLHSSRRFTSGLHSGQEQSNQNADNGDNNKKLNESKTMITTCLAPPPLF